MADTDLDDRNFVVREGQNIYWGRGTAIRLILLYGKPGLFIKCYPTKEQHVANVWLNFCDYFESYAEFDKEVRKAEKRKNKPIRPSRPNLLEACLID